MTTTPAPLDEDARLRVLYGDPALAPPERTPLVAGPLTLVYTSLGDLRYVRWGRHEIVRRLYHAVRDERWGTVPAEITVTERTVGPDSFRIAYEARHRDASRGIDFLARVTLSGTADGTVTYDFDGEALSTFSRNRIGVCVLHPAQECKARPCRVTHASGGEVEEGAFPDLISPHQPFFDIAAIGHGVGDAGSGVTARIDFAGDVFEMEDQRNWLDASYKTYSTPLALPMPVEVPAGTRIRQTVTLSVTGAGTNPPPIEDGPVLVTLDNDAEDTQDPPEIGFLLPDDGRVPSGAVAAVERLAPGFLRLDYDASRPERMQDAARQAGESAQRMAGGRRLPLVAGLSRAPKVWGLEGAPKADEWVIFVQDRAAVADVEGTPDPQSFVTASSRTNFTELNRNAPDAAAFHALGWAANPQVHAFDTLSILETPPMIVEAADTAHSLGNPQLHIGPLTFAGPYRDADPRQAALVGASWYLATLCHALPCTAHRITLCEVSGPRGLTSDDGKPYPVYHALAAFLAARNAADEVIATTIDRTDAVAAVCLRGEAGDATFLVNLTPDEQAVTVRGLRAEGATVRVLDETNALSGFSEPRPLGTPGGEATLTLLPYAIAEVVTSPTPPPASRVPGSPAAGEGS